MFERWQRLVVRVQRRWTTMRRTLLIWACVFVFGIGCVVVGLLLFSPLAQLREISVVRHDPRVDVEQVARALAPLRKRHLFFLSLPEVRALAEPAVPGLKRIDIDKDYPSRLVVDVELHPLIARLEIESPQGEAAGSGAVSVDYLAADGTYVAYQSALVENAATLPVIRITDWAARPVVGSLLIEPEFIVMIDKTERQLLDQFGQKITTRTVFLRSQEFHLHMATYALWFDRRSPLEEQLQRYRLYLEHAGPTAAAEYVDLRLADRIIYK